MTLDSKVILCSIAIIVVLLAAIFIMKKKLDENKDDLAAFKISMSSKLDTIRNKQGQQTASVPVAVYADISNLKATVAQLNSQGANIQSKVDGNTQALVLLSKTIGMTIHGTTTVTGFDTISKVTPGKTDTMKIYPTYGIDTVTKWYNIKASVGPKVFTITPVFYDSTELKGELVSQGFFKPSVLTAFSLNKNPYANTTGLKSFIVRKEPAPVFKYILIALGAAGGFYLGQHLH
jgi:hypothetical protein